MPTYKDIDFLPWALGVGLVSLPVLVLPGRWAWTYVVLVITYYVIFNLDEIGSLVGFIRSKLPTS